MIQLDLNNPEFQANLFSLEKPEAWAVLKTLKLLQVMTWEQIQASKGLRWEQLPGCGLARWFLAALAHTSP